MLDLTPSGFRLHASATLNECADLLRRGEELWPQLPQTGPVIIEFDTLTGMDSSLLAVLLNWQERAQTQSRTVQLRNTPISLCHLAHLYGVDEWIDGLSAA